MLAESIQSLFLDLRRNVPGVSYVMLSHLNQDYLENVFSVLRSYGGFNFNPNCVHFKYRLRKLVLSWNLSGRFDMEVDYDGLTGRVQSDFVAGIFDDQVDEPIEYETRTFNALLQIDKTVDASSELRTADLTKEQLIIEGSKEAVAGRIAKAFMQEHPELSLNKDFENLRDLWVDKVSKGGLTTPSDLWLAYFNKFLAEHFLAVNGYFGIDKRPGIVSRFEDLLVKAYPEMSPKVVHYYAKCRMFIRIEYLNKRMDNEKFIKQHQRATAQLEDNTEEILEENDDVAALSKSGEQLWMSFDFNFL